jgi:predicted dehydrogenase
MTTNKLKVAVIGTGRWATSAHIPGWLRDPRVEVVALSDVSSTALSQAGETFGISRLEPDFRAITDDPDIDAIDVVTGDSQHFEPAWAGLAAGKHVLCEKPVHHDYHKVVEAADLAEAGNLKTKLGFTFRYAPATMYAAELIAQGYVGDIYMMNVFEQNSQWLDPNTPTRGERENSEEHMAVSSIEGYGAPVIDIMHWWMGSALESVVGTMRNFVPSRVARETGQMTRINIDDGDMWIAEFAGGRLASVQSSYVTVGNYPGIEVRVYGSEGALIVRLVEEFGICQSVKGAKKDAVEFVELDIPQRFFPEGGTSRESWRTLFYANLVNDFVSEILKGGTTNQGGFRQAALVQQTINAFERAHRTRAWVDFPID